MKDNPFAPGTPDGPPVEDATSGVDELFGEKPNRPNHDHFWRLIEIILKHDGASEAGEDVVRERLGKVVDLRSVRYIATTRAQRTIQFAKERGWPPVRSLTAAYLDGWLTGYGFAKAEPPTTPPDRMDGPGDA